MTGPEPFVVPDSDEFVVPCPYGQEMLTHKGTCRLSYASTGRVLAIVAKNAGIIVSNKQEGAVT